MIKILDFTSNPSQRFSHISYAKEINKNNAKPLKEEEEEKIKKSSRV